MRRRTASTPEASAPEASLRLRLEIFLWHHGIVWVANTLLILVAAIGSLWALPTLRQRAAAVHDQNLTLVAAAAQLRAESRRVAEPARNSLLEALPEAGELEAQVRAIYALAAKHGLSISKTTFRTVESRRTSIVRLQMSMPLRNQYPPIADFVEDLLRQAPNVSVDQLRFRRDTVAQSEGEADLQLSCWAVRAHDGASSTRSRSPARTARTP